MKALNDGRTLKLWSLCLLIVVVFLASGCTRTTYSVLHTTMPVAQNNASFVVDHTSRAYLGSSPIRVRGAADAQTYNITLHREGFRARKDYLWGSLLHNIFIFSAGIVPLIETSTWSRSLVGYQNFDGMPPSMDYPVMRMGIQREHSFYWGFLFLPMALWGTNVDKADIPANRAVLIRELRGIPEDKLNPFIP